MTTVQAIAWTHFEPPTGIAWSTDADGGQALAEFAGRVCYQSWSKPNPATATNAGYLAHILEVNHLSVLEHGSVTFYLAGVSRSLTHEFVRHRHFSYSQLSQRYVDGRDAPMVEPEVIAADPYLHGVFIGAVDATQRAYAELAFVLERRGERASAVCRTCSQPVVLEGDPTMWRCDACGYLGSEQVHVPDRTAVRKAARQAARSVLPNATETRIVVTGNYRAWRHFITMRATEAADVEIRALAVTILRELQRVAPNVFGDFVIAPRRDGTETAHSPFVERG